MKFYKPAPYLFALITILPALFAFQNCGRGFETFDLSSNLDGQNFNTQSVPALKLKALSRDGFDSSCGIGLEDEIYCWNRIGAQAYSFGKVTNAVEMATTALATCVLNSLGKVLCSSSMAADGSPQKQLDFQQMPALSGVVHIYGGTSRFCALTDQGQVFCWSLDGIAPVDMTQSSRGKSLTMYGNIPCMITAEGTLACLRENQTPLIIPGFSNLVEIVSSTTRGPLICGLDTAGKAKCAEVDFDQLNNVKSVSAFEGVDQIKMISVSGPRTFCAIRTNNEILCGGDNQFFQANSSTLKQVVPMAHVTTLSVRQIRTYADATCVLTTENTVRCWGKPGSTGDNGIHSSTSLLSANELANAKQVEYMGYVHGYQAPYILKNDGTVHCTSNHQIILDVVNRESYDPKHFCPDTATNGFASLYGLANVRQISAATEHACAVIGSGQVTCWGWHAPESPNGLYGQLGIRTSSNTSPFGLVSGINNAIQIVASQRSSCALTEDGHVYCWGQIGATKISSPTPIAGLTNIKSLHRSEYSFCGLRNDSTVACLNTTIKNANDSQAPNDLVAIELPINDIKDIVASGGQFYGLFANGSVTKWIGSTSSSRAYIPEDVPTLAGTARLIQSTGQWVYNEICTLSTAGRIRCLGDNSFGQMGLGHTSNVSDTVDLYPEFKSENLLLGPGFACEVIPTSARCYGRKPYHEIKDLMGEIRAPLQR